MHLHVCQKEVFFSTYVLSSQSSSLSIFQMYFGACACAVCHINGAAVDAAAATIFATVKLEKLRRSDFHTTIHTMCCSICVKWIQNAFKRFCFFSPVGLERNKSITWIDVLFEWAWIVKWEWQAANEDISIWILCVCALATRRESQKHMDGFCACSVSETERQSELHIYNPLLAWIEKFEYDQVWHIRKYTQNTLTKRR